VIFAPQHGRLILEGRKTQTRRLVRPGQAGAAPRCAYRPGRSEPLTRVKRPDERTPEEESRVRHGKGRPPLQQIGRILITDVRRERLGEITFSDARREGFRTAAEFKAAWVRDHDGKWLARQDDPSDVELAARFDGAWADTEVWVISFEHQSQQMFLTPAARPAGTERGYADALTDERGRRIVMPDEPEAVHPDIVEGWARQSERAHQDRRSAQRAVDRRLLDREDRVKRARAAAKLKGIDVKPEVRALRAAQRSRRTEETIERRIVALEDKAQPVVQAEEAA
jgi:hypothetical protein